MSVPEIRAHLIGAGITVDGPVRLSLTLPQQGLTSTILSLLNHQILNGSTEDRKMILSFLENGVEILKTLISEEQSKGAQ